ncbi:MAG TPA: hypothetical protein PLF26_16615 [Blastocatellia bacterium]|nr:hypothetical protein [Blastocatellia bacterium]
MTQDEFDRKMEFLLHWQAKLAAAHEVNIQEHARFQAGLLDLRDDLTVMAQTLTRTIEAMDKRDARRERRLDRLERIVFGHVSDPHAHGPASA